MTRFCCEREVGENESISVNGDAGFDCDWVVKHRPVVRAGVEFAAFPAGIDLWRQVERGCLRFEQLHPYGMHRHSLRRLVDRRHQRADLDVALRPQHMDEPRTVFAAAPGNNTFGHLVIWSSGYLVIY